MIVVKIGTKTKNIILILYTHIEQTHNQKQIVALTIQAISVINGNQIYYQTIFWKHPYLTNEEWFSFINKNKWHTIFAKQYTQMAFGLLYTRYCIYVLEKS